MEHILLPLLPNHVRRQYKLSGQGRKFRRIRQSVSVVASAQTWIVGRIGRPSIILNGICMVHQEAPEGGRAPYCLNY